MVSWLSSPSDPEYQAVRSNEDGLGEAELGGAAAAAGQTTDALAGLKPQQDDSTEVQHLITFCMPDSLQCEHEQQLQHLVLLSRCIAGGTRAALVLHNPAVNHAAEGCAAVDALRM